MSEATSTDEMVAPKKPVKEVQVVVDEGSFQHSTGDTYDGFFEIKKKDHSLKMNGAGVYRTANGEVYTGNWERDKLRPNEPASISYPDGSKYEGIFRECCYYGAGKYTYPDGTVMLANFVENCPVGTIILIDPNGHKWLGRADLGYGWVEPVNHYYDMLDETIEIRKKNRHKASSPPLTQPKPDKKKVKMKG